MNLKLVLPLVAIALTAGAWAKAQSVTSGYAIQNVQTGKNLRPFEAGKADGNRLVLYDHHNWKCMTWALEPTAANTYQLRNFYTGKTFQSATADAPGAALCQQPLAASGAPQWEFIPQPGDTYRIRLRGTELYVATSSEATNSAIVLQPRQEADSQRWRLVKQRPWF